MKATLTVEHDPRILDIFQAEDHDIGRASYEITEQADSIVFEISADDAVAMRTVLNAITKLLSTWEQSAGL